MALRPSQIRATSSDSTLMIPGALSLRGRYKELSMPVVIMAGDGDKIVFMRHAKRLQANIKGSILHIVKGAGHMFHHIATHPVVEAIESVIKASGAGKGGEFLPSLPEAA
jgi:pimeloyl-ACP methyl ester carboxylesterase